MKRHTLLAALCAAAAWQGCGGRDLEPATMAHRVAGLEGAAKVEDGGVEILAQTAPWPGPETIQDVVTPIRVRIDNHSDVPVRIRYSDFQLVGRGGEVFRALPPYRIEGRVPRVVGIYENVDPRVDAAGFSVAPAYTPVYGEMDPFLGPFDYDPHYYRTYYSDWRRLPTAEMLSRALPEGVIQPGGYVAGYLYFQQVGDEEAVRFTANLSNADTGGPVASLSIPFAIE